jgi:hypothetical protein
MATANVTRTTLRNKQMVDNQINPETWTRSTKRCEMDTRHVHISQEIDVCKDLDADTNFPTMHFLSHWVQLIPQYAVLIQDSAKGLEQSPKTNLKVSWTTFNHNLNHHSNVITIQRRIVCFELRELNGPDRAPHRENSTADPQHPPFRYFCCCPPGPLVICEALKHGASKRPCWKAS